MSTATARTAGDNEFPVLLRLPDLNAPVWPAKGIIAPVPVAVTEPVAPPAEVKVATETTTTAPPVESATAPSTTTSAGSLAATARTHISHSVEVATQAAQTVQRVTRQVLTEPRFKLLRQFGGGGLLVGGLALTYLMIMGGDNKTPDHITQAETTLEPPVIDTGDLAKVGDGPVIVRPDPHSTDIAPVPGPPALDRSWELPPDTTPEMPDHIAVVADRYEPGVPQPEPREAYRPEVRETDPSEYQGRIGPRVGSDWGPNGGPPVPNRAPPYPEPRPSVVLPSIEGRTYPVTDRANFEFRPPTFPREGARVDTARRYPAPPPR